MAKRLVKLALTAVVSDTSEKQSSSYVDNIEEIVDAGLIFADGNCYAELQTIQNDDTTYNN